MDRKRNFRKKSEIKLKKQISKEECDMAFFDRLNEMAKTVSEKTNDSLEINKQIAQIKAEARQERQSVKRNAQNARRQKRRRRRSRRKKGRALKRSLCLSARNAARCLPRDRNSAVNVASR